jgi:hypothetical protein
MLAALALAWACSYDTAPASRSATDSTTINMLSVSEARPAAQTALQQPGGFATARPAAPAMLIRRAYATITVDSVHAAVHELHAIARKLGGVIATSLVQTSGPGQAATLVARVPVERLDQAVAALSTLGKVDGVRTTSEDVGEEFVDVSARLVNARRLEQRLLQVLAARTGGLKDVLQVEEALARVREEIERIEGRRRYLETQAAVSTLEVRIQPAPVAVPVGHRFATTLAAAAHQAQTNLVAITGFAIASLGVVVPLIVLALPIWFLVRRYLRDGTEAHTA